MFTGVDCSGYDADMKKEMLIVIVLAIIILALAVVLFWPVHKETVLQSPPPADIEVFSPKPNEVVSSPLKITGVVRGNGWNGFEGQVGGVELLDANGAVLAQGPLTAITEWTQLPTNFETTLIFPAPAIATGSLVFHNENASGDPAKDKTVIVPVKFK